MTSKSGLVFEGARGGMLSDMALSSVMRKLHAEKVEDDGEGWRESQKPNRPAVVHGLRSTGRDWAAINGYPRELAELALGHRIGSKVEQAYSRDSLAERRRAMMEGWSEFLTGTKEGGHLRIVVG